jgi:hypothetical protein
MVSEVTPTIFRKIRFSYFCRKNSQKPNNGVIMLSSTNNTSILSWEEEGGTLEIRGNKLGLLWLVFFLRRQKGKKPPPSANFLEEKGLWMAKNNHRPCLHDPQAISREKTPGDIKQQVLEESGTSDVALFFSCLPYKYAPFSVVFTCRNLIFFTVGPSKWLFLMFYYIHSVQNYILSV